MASLCRPLGPLQGQQTEPPRKALRFQHVRVGDLISLLVLFVLAVAVGAAYRKTLLRKASPPRGEFSVHRCDFCREAILLIDDDAKSFVQHLGPKPLFGYRVVNACGACARERMVDGMWSFEGADPSA
jgi:hypothetical protein